MASLKRFPDSRYWFAVFIGPNGKQRCCSTKEIEKRRAQKIADRFELAARMARLGGLAARQARKVIGEIYEISNRAPLPSDTISEYFTRWSANLKTTHGHKTAVRYSGIVKAFLEWLERSSGGGARLLIQLESAELARFRDHYARDHSPASVNTALDCIQSALTDAFQDNLIDTNEAKRVTRLPDKAAKPQERRPFTDREIRAILEAAKEDPEWYGMVLTGLYHGFRLGDVADLCWPNVDLELRQFRFDTEKTGRAVNIPIAEPFHRYLMEIAGDDPAGPLFPKANALRGRDVPTSALSNQFYRIMEKAEVVEKRTNKKRDGGPGRAGRRQSPGLGFHCFRYTATSLLKRAGVSDVVAREIIGHESAAVSRLYTNIDTPTLQAAMSKVEDFTLSQNDDDGVAVAGAEQIQHLQQSEPEFPGLRFKFAKTMPDTPHWYVVRSAENYAEYKALSDRIAEQGTWETWKDGKRYQYLYLGDYKYWRIDPVINRARAGH
jgi:integrase